jgi:hypothetical protein
LEESPLDFDDMDYDEAVEIIEKQNDELLFEFQEWLLGKGLSKSTVIKHTNSIEFYINNYLLYDEIVLPQDGGFRIGGFLGNWFIRKAMWSSVSAIKAYTVTFKKFYKFLSERGDIPEEEYEYIVAGIKEGLPDWIEAMEEYMSPDFEFEDWLLVSEE